MVVLKAIDDKDDIHLFISFTYLPIIKKRWPIDLFIDDIYLLIVTLNNQRSKDLLTICFLGVTCV